MQAQTYRSMDAACTGVWRTEVSWWGLGADTQWVWGQSTSLAKPPENRCRLHTPCQRGGIGREVTVESVVGWEFIISQLTREPQLRVILCVLVYSGSWLLAIITPKYKKIENITGVGKVMLHCFQF